MASFYFDERLRVDAASALSQLRRLGVQHAHILSGDAAPSVARIAHELQEAQKLLTHERLSLATKSGLKPQDKLLALRSLQAQGRCVAMVGDGLNDGPVLAGANVSFAFGRAVPLARAQSDFLLMGERLVDVARGRAHAQKTMRVMRQNLVWAFAYNVFMVPLAFLGLVNAWQAGLGMALSSILVVANAMRLVRLD
jgi:Cu2+-exporting ATPase